MNGTPSQEAPSDGIPDVRYLAGVRPSHRQWEWQRTEFYGFVHVGVNTMTDREWGAGHEDPALFDPAHLDADAWVATFARAGMRGVVLTAKHHDGFCLWPSAQTAHTVAASPWRDGGGDLVAEVSAACARHGLKFGVYLSPWDRTEASYGSGAGYDDFFVAQLTELLTGYGEVFSVWFDGANGEGPDGRVQTYDWDRYHRVVRALQPGAAISVCGPDVRWCGNEAGHTRADEWSVVPHELRSAERTAEASQKVDDGEFSRAVRSDTEDLGSRAALAGYRGECVWYPAEVNTSIRPGWFHHPAEDGDVRDADELFALWRRSVGGNATFLLNVPPAADGRLGAPDVTALEGLGSRLREFAATDLLTGADLRFSSGAPAPLRIDHDADLPAWRPAADDEEPTVTAIMPRAGLVRAVCVREDVRAGQRVEHLDVDLVRAGEVVWSRTVHSVGYQRILDVPDVEADALRIVVRGSRGTPHLLGLAVRPAPGTSEVSASARP